jgi:hypothetical protein
MRLIPPHLEDTAKPREMKSMRPLHAASTHTDIHHPHRTRHASLGNWERRMALL